MNDKKQNVIIRAENVGVSYISGYKSDDYKSRVLNFLRGKKEEVVREKIWPIRNINITGYQGEILGIIGSNGSGKTTLCRLISGILRPDEGNLTVNGKVTALFSFGLGFNRELTGRENVYLSGMMLGLNKRKMNEYIDQIHEFSGIGDFFDQPVKRYSSGMRARLGFSVVAFMEPEILILDEALNTGDLEFGEKASAKMRELVNKAKMVILVTHSLRYAKESCDRIIWLDKGVIRADGDPEEVAELYQNSLPPKKNQRKEVIHFRKTEAESGEDVVIEAKNVDVMYKLNRRPFYPLRNINFRIREGEIVGVIGHNGAGKSTLCKLLSQILVPDAGKLRVEGRTTSLLGLGGGFNLQLSGKDNVYLNGMLLGIPKQTIEEKYPNIVEFSGLKKFIDKPLKQYSSGMKSRLGFSITAAIRPDIIIIDEALSAGDAAFQQKASEKIQEMIGQAKAVIVVTHSMSFVENVCTRAIWLDRGTIRFDGDPTQAVALYRANVKEKKVRKSG